VLSSTPAATLLAGRCDQPRPPGSSIVQRPVDEASMWTGPETASPVSPTRYMQPLQSKPKLELNVTEQQFRAIGHVILQWAYLESEIVDESFWLFRRSEHKKKKRPKRYAKFSEKATRWRKLARRSYKKYPDLIRSVDRISGQAIKIKKERDSTALPLPIPTSSPSTSASGNTSASRQSRLLRARWWRSTSVDDAIRLRRGLPRADRRSRPSGQPGPSP
jgi:hypothetical protein